MAVSEVDWSRFPRAQHQHRPGVSGVLWICINSLRKEKIGRNRRQRKKSSGERLESIKQVMTLKPERQVRLALLLVSTSIIISTSLLAYNMITYEFTLAVGNTGQSALGPPTSAGVGIVFAMIVVAAILGFGAVLSIFGSLRNLSNRITDVVKESSPRDSIS